MIDQFTIFKPFKDQLIHGVTTKLHGGNFKENQPEFEPSIEQLKKETGLKNPVTTIQIHTDKIINVTKAFSEPPQADALITQQKNLTLLIKVADCQGVLMFDPVTQSIAAIHSGWKGSVLNIIGKTIQKMKQEFNVNPKNLLVGISASLGPCCCEFSDPKKELPNFVHAYIKDNNHVDFWQLSLDQLKAEGITENHIEIANQCTKCHSDKYYSYRHQDPERMGVFISLTK